MENLLRSIPNNLSLNIDLSKIKIMQIFKWLKSKNISDKEMMNTFNCGIGFCLIAPKKNLTKIKKIFTKEFMPYEIGHIVENRRKSLFEKLFKMVRKNTCIFISGYGSNLKNLINQSRDYNFPINIRLVISNNKKAYGITYAKKNSIPFFFNKYKN